MTWAFRLLVLISFVVLFASDSEACSCGFFGRGPACQETWNGAFDAVLLGRVEKIEPASGTPGKIPGSSRTGKPIGLLRVTIKVEEGYKGVSEDAIEVYTFSYSAACGFAFHETERYLIYAEKDTDGRLDVSLCSPTRPAKYAEDDLAYLRSIPSLPHSAWIMGSVWRYTHDPNFKPKFQPSLMDHYRPPEQEYKAMRPESGAKVTVEAQDATRHEVIADSEGNWRVSDLSPGRYTVHADVDPTIFVHPFRSTVDIEPRGCARVDIRIESNGNISGTLKHHAPEDDWVMVKVFVMPLHNYALNHPFMERDLAPSQSTYEIGPLPAGQYLLGAYVVKRLGTPERYTFANWGWTYYPAVTDINQAQPITVSEGKSVSNVVLKMSY